MNKRGKLFIKIEVEGENFEFLTKTVYENNLQLLDLIFTKRGAILTVDYVDRRKIFAILHNLCYNIIEVSYSGKTAFFKRAVHNLPFIICSVCLLILMITGDGYISKITYAGDGEYLKKEINCVLEESGITAGKIYKANSNELSNKILVSSNKFSFVAVRKKGRILEIEAYKAKVTDKPLDVKKERITSLYDGKVIHINCMSGTPLVKIGDSVKKGDVLIDGYFTKNEEKYKTYALGEVEIEICFKYRYESKVNGKEYENRARAIANIYVENKNILKTESKYIENSSGGYYEVSVYYSEIVN